MIKILRLKTIVLFYGLFMLLTLFGCGSNNTQRVTDINQTELPEDINEAEVTVDENQTDNTTTNTNKDSEEEVGTVVNPPSVPTASRCQDPIAFTKRTKYIKSEHYFITFPTPLQMHSKMYYCDNQVEKLGAAFEFRYVDNSIAGNTSSDGYPNGGAGGLQEEGSWHPSNKNLTMMPVKLSELKDSIFVQWKVSQENALNDNDKWMASINMIFDGGNAKSKPLKENRNYDLVIELNSYNFKNDLEDRSTGDKTYYFARNADGSLKTFDITVNGRIYKFAVRYKFYKSGIRANKAHVKYIPIDEANIPPYINNSIKSFIDNSKKYIKYANMPDNERALANTKIAKPNLYLKSIRGGYEVYRGESILRNDFFKVVDSDK